MNKVFLISGSNVGNRLMNLTCAKELIGQRIGNIIRVSHIYETEPWEFKSVQSFYNQCLLVESEMEPGEILKVILNIEKKMGRIRSGRSYRDRIIDIDILFFSSETIQTKKLTIPHPRLHKRKFVLIPLAEIAPDFVHPVYMKSILQLLQDCENNLKVNQLNLN